MANVLIRLSTMLCVLLTVAGCQTEEEMTQAKVTICKYDEGPVIKRALVYKNNEAKVELLALRDSLLQEENALPVEQAYLSYRVGQLYDDMQEERLAINQYAEALDQFLASDTVVMDRVLQMYFNLANKYFELEVRDSSNLFANKGLDLIYSEGPCEVNESKAVYLYRTIGVNLREFGDLAGSSNYFTKGAEICRTGGPNYRYCGQLMDDYAYTLLSSGQLKESKKIIEEGERYITNQEIINYRDSMVLTDIYETYYAIADKEENLEDADVKARKSLAINLGIRSESSFAANSYNNLGRVLIAKKEYRKGEGYLRKALSLYRANKDFTDEGTCYENFAKSSLFQGDTLMALDYLDSAALAYHGLPELPGLSFALDKQQLKDPIFNQAKLITALHLSQADAFPLDKVRRSVARVDSIIGFLQYRVRSEGSKRQAIVKLRALYDQLINFSYQQWQETGDEQYQQLGVQYLERGKSQILKERRRRISNSIAVEADEQQQEVRALREDLYALKAQVRDSNDPEFRRKIGEKIKLQDLRLRNLQEEIYSQKSSVYEYDGGFSDLREISSKLEGDEVVLDYFLGDEKAYVAVAAKGQVEMKLLPLHPDSIGSMAERLMDCFDAFRRPRWKEDRKWQEEKERIRIDLSYRLYEGLIKSVLPNAKAFKRLTVIPDGVLAILPFSALLTEPTPKDGADSSYLLSSHTINYEFSAGIWKDRLSSPYSGGMKALIVAPFQAKTQKMKMPVSGKLVSLARLGYVDQEVAAVANNVESVLLHGPEACELADKSTFSNYGILHFSGHGKVFPDDVSQSFLVLDLPINEAPCLLRLPDLEAKKMNVDLLVLSACETGAGELAQEEGIISLSRAGAIAGAGSVISSLWVVNQESKAELFSLFYKHLAEGDRRDDALRTAQRYFLESGEGSAHPYHWAGFLNTGSGQTVRASYEK